MDVAYGSDSAVAAVNFDFRFWKKRRHVSDVRRLPRTTQSGSRVAAERSWRSRRRLYWGTREIWVRQSRCTLYSRKRTSLARIEARDRRAARSLLSETSVIVHRCLAEGHLKVPYQILRLFYADRDPDQTLSDAERSPHLRRCRGMSHQGWQRNQTFDATKAFG